MEPITLIHLKNNARRSADGISTYIEELNKQIRGEFYATLNFPDDFLKELSNFRPYSLRAVLGLFSAVKRQPNRVIMVAHTFPMILFAAIIKMIFSQKVIKFIIIEHRVTTNRRMLLFFLIDFLIYKSADNIISVSDAAHRSLLKWLNRLFELGNRLSHKMLVIKNGVTKFRTTSRNTFIFRKLVFIGRLHVDKDPFLLIELGKLKLQGIESILIIGTGELINNIKDSLEFYSGTPIHLLGEQSDPFSKIDEDSVVIVPSRTEGFGLVAAEAMVNEFPLVCSNVEALMELSEDGKLCWVAKAGDVMAFASAITDILSNPNMAELKIKLAKQAIESKYNWTVSGRKFLHVVG